MQLSAFANTLIVAWYFVAGCVGLIGLLLLARTLRALEQRLAGLERQIAPLLARTDTLLTLGEHQMRDAAQRTEAILALGEHAAAAVDSTASESSRLVKGVVYRPFVELNAVLSGISAGGFHLLGGFLRSFKGSSK